MTKALIGKTSLGLAGWSIAKDDNWSGIGRQTAPTSSCWAFNDPADEDGLRGQNVQVARLIVALGVEAEHAIFRALCEIGLQGTLAPIGLFEIEEEDPLFPCR